MCAKNMEHKTNKEASNQMTKDIKVVKEATKMF